MEELVIATEEELEEEAKEIVNMATFVPKNLGAAFAGVKITPPKNETEKLDFKFAFDTRGSFTIKFN